jgi:hypothetical protein
MIFSVGFIGVAVMIEAWPIYLIAVEALHSEKLKLREFWIIAPSLAAVFALTIVAVAVPLRLGFKNLTRLRD